MAMQDEIGRVLGDRAREPIAAEKGPDSARLALEGRARRRVMKQDDTQRAGRHLLETPLQSRHLRARLRIDGAEDGLAEIRQRRVGEAPDEALRPDDPDAGPVQLADRPPAIEDRDSPVLEHADDLISPARVPVVIPEHGDDWDREAAACASEHGSLVGLAVRRQVPGEQNEIGFAGDPPEGRLDFLAALGRAVDVSRGRDRDRCSFHRQPWQGTPSGMANEEFEALLNTLKRAAAALRDAGVPFMLGGGLAAWARGGPESDHDLDLMVKPEDADRALEVLAGAGMRPERPPEGWLYKAWDDNGVLLDLIFEPVGMPVGDEAFARAEELEVKAVAMPVMSLEDVLVTKLLALDEQNLDYKALLQIARPVREQVDWEAVRSRTAGSPYAAAFFTLVEGLGILESSPSNG
jgi:Uncharacterised nucleotidyltransferase